MEAALAALSLRTRRVRLAGESHKHHSDHVVRGALARHLSVPVGGFAPCDDLEKHLRLERLDLVLIALRLEAAAGTEFPMPRLEGVHTVAQLADGVAGCIAQDAAMRPRVSELHTRQHDLRTAATPSH
jgi:hypothetical protein